MTAALGIAFWHLLVQDATPSGHPLDITSPQQPLVPEAIAVLDRSAQNISDRLDTSVRVPREAISVVVWIVIAQVVEQQKGIVGCGLAEAKSAMHANAGTFDVWFRFDNLFWYSHFLSLPVCIP